MPDAVAEITAVVLNWRTPDYTIRSVQSLIADGIPPARVVVVDNASGDDSAERFARALPDVGLLLLDENVGFARANNRAAASLPSSLGYLLVNADAFVHRPGSLARLVLALTQHDAGIAIPRLLNADLTLQPTVVPFARPLAELVRASGLSRLVPDRFQPSFGTHWSHDRSRPIEAATGAVLLVRADAWQALGGFDESIFMYTEDLDLFWRAARSGWRAWFVADAEFVHLGGSSAQQRWSNPERAERIARAEARMLRQHLGPARAVISLGAKAAGVGLRAIAHRALGHEDAAREQAAWFRGFVSRRERARVPRA